MMRPLLRASGLTAVMLLTVATLALGQEPPGPSQPAPPHQHGGESSTAELFPAREASGTAWLPDESPMYGFERRVGQWTMMLDGTAVGQFLYEPGEIHRTGGFSSKQVSSVNWLMGMARRPAGKGRVGLRAMVSFEPWTVSDCGFINMLASGEMCEGDTIHDRQHPHDLFMELAADYDRPIRGSLRWQLYAGFAGEPALGPPAFPHRISAMPNPIAPITHHWLDSSHISFGLITIGVSERRWKAEISVFNGREPDEARADVDLGPLDSVSARVTLLPTPRLALQVSAAHLHAAEAEFPPQPRSDVDRVTASATYHRMTGAAIWATTLAYGMNAGPEVIPGDVVHLTTHAGLLESTLVMSDRHTWFGRAELVGKPGHDLHMHATPATIFPIGKVQAGYVRSFLTGSGIVLGVGGTASVSIVPPALVPRYPRRANPGFGVFASVRPARHGAVSVSARTAGRGARPGSPGEEASLPSSYASPDHGAGSIAVAFVQKLRQ